MEVYTSFRLKADVNPIDVIDKLLEKEIGWKGWIFEENGKFYKGWEQSAGNHSFDEKEEISKEEYDYIAALRLIKNKLKK